MVVLTLEQSAPTRRKFCSESNFLLLFWFAQSLSWLTWLGNTVEWDNLIRPPIVFGAGSELDDMGAAE